MQPTISIPQHWGYPRFAPLGSTLLLQHRTSIIELITAEQIASSMGEPHQQLYLAVAHLVAVEVDIDSQKRSLS
jgi:hypothetical protein